MNKNVIQKDRECCLLLLHFRLLFIITGKNF